jgi:hypothetical protein
MPEDQTWRMPERPSNTSGVVQATKLESSSERVMKLIELGILTHLEGYTWGRLIEGRFFVFANVKGVPIPMYRTKSYTGNKSKDFSFFPFFGVRLGKDGRLDWLVKGSTDNSNSFYGIPELRTASEILTQVFDLDTTTYTPDGKEADSRKLNDLLQRRFKMNVFNLADKLPVSSEIDALLYRDISERVFDEIRKRE